MRVALLCGVVLLIVFSPFVSLPKNSHAFTWGVSTWREMPPIPISYTLDPFCYSAYDGTCLFSGPYPVSYFLTAFSSFREWLSLPIDAVMSIPPIIPSSFVGPPEALDELTALVGEIDRKIQSTEPFKVVKTESKKGRILIEELVRELYTLATALELFLPRTAHKILSLITEHKMPDAPLFNRFS